ncbi:MAG: hypothetical protein J7L45_02195 [Candidatus Aenigmarchaeota archaeon]|nr:hypothetical protein [Candidatus Aenigmarchaeota archaeon]
MIGINVGIFHDDALGRDLGKRGSQTDILFFNRKMDDHIFTFLQPRNDEIIPKSQILSVIDTAILSVGELSPSVGETILMLDAMKINEGLVVSDAPEVVKPLVKGTSLESFEFVKRDPTSIIEMLKLMNPSRDTSSPTTVVIDQSFNVKGVGDVALGFVKRGVLRKYDKLMLLPPEKEIVVKSIQVHDKDFEEAAPGMRVGVAVKGASVDDMRRGSILSKDDSIKVGDVVEVSFEPNKFYTNFKEGAYHLTVGMQSLPVNVEIVSNNRILLRCGRKIAYRKDDVFVLLDLNGKKLRFVGAGHPI